MDIQLEKADIIRRFKQVNDESLVQAFKSLLDYALSRDKKNTEDGLSTSIDRALEQVKEGKITPHNQVREKYKKWL